MTKLQQAKKLGAMIRYRHDKAYVHSQAASRALDPAKDYFYQSHLLIDDKNTPLLEEGLTTVCQRLSLPRQAVTAFVYASPETQAGCLSVSANECVVQISSGLVNLLNQTELEFVMGHELGHFILDHSAINRSDKSAEYYMQLRAQEISSDRLGLLGCENLNSAICALIKLMSGLTEKHLGLDIGQFISQIKKVSNLDSGIGAESSHPNMAVRCRALLWFESTDILNHVQNNDSKINLDSVDDKVKEDMDKFVDKAVMNAISSALEQCAMWEIARFVLQDGRFDKGEQRHFEKRFGADKLKKFKAFISAYTPSDAQKAVLERLNDNRTKLQELIPERFEKEYKKMLADIAAQFKGG